MNTFTRRMITALAGPAIAAGVLAGGAALGATAQAAAQPAGATCVTASMRGPVSTAANPLTRAAQVGAIAPQRQAPVRATSCTSH